MSDSLAEWLKKYGIVVTFLGLLLSGFLSPFGLDNLVSAYTFLGAALLFALAWWKVWEILPQYKKRRLLLRSIVLILIITLAVGWGYFLWWASQPHFRITALNTLKSDRNAYELNDMLIWSQNNLDECGFTITFTLEILPVYYGKQKFGQMIALVSGDGGKPPLEIPLWDSFSSESSPQQIQLTLPDLLRASGLRENSFPPSNPFRPGVPKFQEARLIVQVAWVGDKEHPWASEEVIIRNAPWELRSKLVWRNNRHEIDSYVRNLGGTGEFALHYALVRLNEKMGSDTHPMYSGTTLIGYWYDPNEFMNLDRGQFITHTASLLGQLAPGRYLLEVYVIKKHNYIRFEDPGVGWENLGSLKCAWWLADPEQAQTSIFLVTTPEFAMDATIQAEWERLRAEQGVDLGPPLGLAEEVTSVVGTVALQQAFQDGEIYLRNGQAYALYGSILEHYEELGGIQNHDLGFPVSAIQVVTSSSGMEGVMAEFEGRGSPHPPTAIYASSKGVAATWQWIRQVYSREQGGHSGWLGFPLADEQDYAVSTVQTFEYGYIVYYYPYVGAERDWSRPPIAYPYLTSRGILFDADAKQPWQNTGVQVQQGDRVTIVQVGGTWALWGFGSEGPRYDANGDADLGPDPQKHTPLPLANTGALIGKIGENLFLVGRWSVLTAPAGGTLYLAMNDDNYEDNAGLITVQIMVED